MTRVSADCSRRSSRVQAAVSARRVPLPIAISRASPAATINRANTTLRIMFRVERAIAIRSNRAVECGRPLLRELFFCYAGALGISVEHHRHELFAGQQRDLTLPAVDPDRRGGRILRDPEEALRYSGRTTLSLTAPRVQQMRTTSLPSSRTGAQGGDGRGDGGSDWAGDWAVAEACHAAKSTRTIVFRHAEIVVKTS